MSTIVKSRSTENSRNTRERVQVCPPSTPSTQPSDSGKPVSDRVSLAAPEEKVSKGFEGFVGALKGAYRAEEPPAQDFEGVSGTGQVEVEKSGPLDFIGDLFGGGEDDLARDVAAPESRLLEPSGEHAPPGTLGKGKELRVTTFNVHHMEGPGDAGDPGQTDEIIGSLRDKAPSDAYLLQEMPPDDAQEVADRMGMKGYYSRTTEGQGNMILLHPDLQVEKNERAVLNGDFIPGDEEGAKRALDYHGDTPDGDDVEGQFREPRAVQALQVRKPGGQGATLWNTHLTAGLEDNQREDGDTLGELRAEEARKLDQFLDDFGGRQPVIGGGDLNSRPGESVPPILQNRGHQLISDQAQEQLDHIVVKGARAHTVLNERLYDGDTQISDHPILSTVVHLRAPEPVAQIAAE